MQGGNGPGLKRTFILYELEKVSSFSARPHTGSTPKGTTPFVSVRTKASPSRSDGSANDEPKAATTTPK